MSSAFPLLKLCPELVIHLADVGELSVRDAVAIRSTCRDLRGDFEHKSIWVAMAKAIQVYKNPPIPYLRSLDQMSPGQVMRGCMRYHNTRRNLSSPTPQPRESRVLVTENEGDPVFFFGIVPGGRHALAVHMNGVVNLWDTAFRQTGSRSSGTSRTPSPVGKIVGSYRTMLAPSRVNFVTSGDDSETMTVLISGYREREPQENEQLQHNGLNSVFDPKCCVIRFTRRAGRAEVERLLEYDVQDARAGIALSSDCAACCMGDHDDLLVDVVDLRHPGRRVLLKHKLDAVILLVEGLLHNGDLLVYTGTCRSVTLHAYRDIGGHLPNGAPSTPVGNTITLPPTSSRAVILPEITPGFGLNSWSHWPIETPNGRLPHYLTIPSVCNNVSGPKPPSRLHIFDGASLLQQLLANDAQTTDIVPNTTTGARSVSWSAVAQTNCMVRPILSTCGEYLMCLCSPDDGTRRYTLEVLALPVRGDHAPTTEGESRRMALQLDLEWERVVAMDISGEAGTFAFAMEPRQDYGVESGEQRIYLFDF